MLPVTVSKNITVASSTGITTFSSGNVVGTVNSSNLGTARRISIWGSSGSSGVFVITGTGQTGNPQSESVTGSTTPGTAVATTQDFLTVTGVSVTGTNASTTSYVGTNTVGGTPWYVIDTYKSPINVAFNLTPSTTSILVNFEYTLDYPSYNAVTGLWSTQNPNTGPIPTISSMGSSVTSNTSGYITTPITAWRITLTSTATGAGTAAATVLQSG